MGKDINKKNVVVGRTVTIMRVVLVTALMAEVGEKTVLQIRKGKMGLMALMGKL